MKKKFLIVQPHSDDAILSCSRYLFDDKIEVEVLTVEKNDRRLEEDRKISDLIGVKYFNLGVEVTDGYYHDFFKTFGRNAELNQDNVLNFYAEKFGTDKIVELAERLNEIISAYKLSGYTILCPLGIGHPFHYLVKILIQDNDKLIYYREFPHAYKRKAELQFVKEIDNLSCETFDDKEISNLKYQIAQKYYRTQSGFFFYEKERIAKNLPEEFYFQNRGKQKRHIKIYVISKGRPNGKTFDILRRANEPYVVVVEPQDEAMYRKAGHKNIEVLPENDRGVAYVRNYVKNKFDGVNPVVMMDDDINQFYYSIDGERKCSYSLKTPEEFRDMFDKLNEQILNTDFDYGTLGKSAFDWNTEDTSPKLSHDGKGYSACVVVIIINNKKLTKVDFDESLLCKSDVDFSLKCMYLGFRYAKFIKFLQQTKMNKNVQQSGGLCEIYKQRDKIEQSQRILLERWPDNLKEDEKKKANNGVTELRVVYKIAKTIPSIIKQYEKLKK